MAELGMPLDGRWCRWATVRPIRSGPVASIRLEDHANTHRLPMDYLPYVVTEVWHGYSYEAFGLYVDPPADLPPRWPFRRFPVHGLAEPMLAQWWRQRVWHESSPFVAEIRWHPNWRASQLWFGGGEGLPDPRAEYTRLRRGLALLTELAQAHPGGRPDVKRQQLEAMTLGELQQKWREYRALYQQENELADTADLPKEREPTKEEFAEHLGFGETLFREHLRRKKWIWKQHFKGLP
jgi:hypothetical protein